MKPEEGGNSALYRNAGGQWLPIGGSGSGSSSTTPGSGSSEGSSGSGCDCPYKAGTPVLIDQLPENPNGDDFELTKADLAAAFGITEQDVDSIFEFARPYIGVYSNVTKRTDMFSLSSCGYDNGVTYVEYYGRPIDVTFASLSGSYTYYIDLQDM